MTVIAGAFLNVYFFRLYFFGGIKLAEKKNYEIKLKVGQHWLKVQGGKLKPQNVSNNYD